MSSHCPLYKAGIYLSPSLLILHRDLSTPKTYRKCPDESISVMLKWWVQNTRGNRERGVINDKTKVQIALIKLMNTVEPSALCLKSSKDCNPNKNPESHILIQHTKHPKVSGTTVWYLYLPLHIPKNSLSHWEGQHEPLAAEHHRGLLATWAASYKTELTHYHSLNQQVEPKHPISTQQPTLPSSSTRFKLTKSKKKSSLLKSKHWASCSLGFSWELTAPGTFAQEFPFSPAHIS